MFSVRRSTFDVPQGKGGALKIVPFVAENAATALAQIHEKLGPDAVVLSIRKLPAQGMAWLWNRQGHVEVLAAVLTQPETVEAAKSLPEVLETSRVKWDDSIDLNPPADVTTRSRPWRSITWLESLGLMPSFANVLEERVRKRQGDKPPTTPTAEWSAVREALIEFWRPPVRDPKKRTHVFIGPPGSGKTTVLCKWLTASVLSEEHSANVWRLDSVNANTSEFLSVHCEMLGVPISRYWDGDQQRTAGTPVPRSDLSFVDLPGVECNDSRGLAALAEQISALPSPCVHLVLNAAYETSILFDQYRAYAALKPDDLIFTHLDEERQRVKLWNFVLGTNCSIQFLSAGQKIPGEFLRAESALLFPQENRL
jgi:flagellar biosynthesis protein FlhF